MPGKESHFINRSNWLRAAVLGANDGIISVASLITGVASANTDRTTVVLAGVAGLVAGALSMAAGEYVSVSSQCDIEQGDIKREKEWLDKNPDMELKELQEIYMERGLSQDLSLKVAQELTRHDALEAHVRDELGITETTKANPLQAAFASGLSFVFGAVMPLAVALVAPVNNIVYFEYALTLLFLAILGMVSAKTGGATVWKSILRVCFWGAVAMVLTSVVGYIFGVKTTV